MLLLREIFITEYFSFMEKLYQISEDNSTNNMKQVIHRFLNSRILFSSLIIVLAFSTSSFAQDGDPVKGKSLFNTNCAACHNLDKKMTGPALRNVEARLMDEQGLDREWMSAWIRNSAAVIKSGDSYGNKIYAEYSNAAMTAMPQLSDEDINNILAYTAQEKTAPVSAADAAIDNPYASTEGGISNELILGALAVLFALLALGLIMVNKTLRRFAKANNVDIVESVQQRSLWKAFVQNQFLMLVTAIFLLLGSGYFVFGYLMQIGIDQGYQPVQPIHYSHKIHAGDNKIDCQFCHSSARVSKTSGIPSLNVCMNCHKTIYEYNGETTAEYSKEFYDGEIKKLYAAVGWDDANQEYTGETQAVKWVRIHNLPDFAYFNHSQHVTVADIECQTCHGPVEEMEIMYQFAPLTMGWCINCHKETNVNVKDNAYYTKIHEELSKKYEVDQLTAAQMGGMECGKCHY
jgi:mono/diheme cytochrome c family protein